MSKLLAIIGWGVLTLWFVNFDADAYHQKKLMEQGLIESSDQATDEPATITEQEEQDYIFPLKGKSLDDVISGYGDPRSNGARIHEGIDIPEERGTAVLAVADGKIVKVANKGGGGKQVWLAVGSKTFFYAHLDSWLVEEGQIVEQGDILGTVGNTGNASHTLPHLHFGIYVGRGKTIDPVDVFDKSA